MNLDDAHAVGAQHRLELPDALELPLRAALGLARVVQRGSPCTRRTSPRSRTRCDRMRAARASSATSADGRVSHRPRRTRARVTYFGSSHSSSSFTVSLRPAAGTPVTITATENFASLRVSSCAASKIVAQRRHEPAIVARSSAVFAMRRAVGLDAATYGATGGHLLRDAVDVAAAEQDLARLHADDAPLRERCASSVRIACRSRRGSSSGTTIVELAM